MKTIRRCFVCKEQFRAEEIVDYASPRAVNTHPYCPNCLKEKIEKDRFTDKVCEIFGIKAPGPRIWRERQKLQDTYGYTDNVIIDCLDYIYNVRHMKKLSESLVLVTPSMVHEMQKYKSNENAKIGGIIAAMKSPMEHQQVEIEENTEPVIQDFDLDDFLND